MERPQFRQLAEEREALLREPVAGAGKVFLAAERYTEGRERRQPPQAVGNEGVPAVGVVVLVLEQAEVQELEGDARELAEARPEA